MHASRATYEIQFGHLERPTHANTSWDVARFEVCAHRWADLGEPGYGVALLNDCKYGYDIRGNVMRLSLLRSPGWPDPESDRGTNHFSYALFPHAGDLREAGVIEEAEAFNIPLVVRPKEAQRAGWYGYAPLLPSSSVSIVSVDRPNVTIEAVKKADRDDALVVRLSEAWGARCRVRLWMGVPRSGRSHGSTCSSATSNPSPESESVVELDLRPFELVTLKFATPSPPMPEAAEPE